MPAHSLHSAPRVAATVGALGTMSQSKEDAEALQTARDAQSKASWIIIGVIAGQSTVPPSRKCELFVAATLSSPWCVQSSISI